MFCDLVGSTELSERLDPEDLQDVLDGFQQASAAIIAKHRGTVARYMGDGLLVYFGWPQAEEYAPELAVRAGLAIVDAVHSLTLQPRIELRTRIGISTGEVVVGHLIGEGIAAEHSVLGTTPNLAARLLALAEPDSVVISQSTRLLLGRLFEYRDLGAHVLKGFAEPVAAWRVLGEASFDSRFEATHGVPDLTPLVGRREELAVLSDRWHKAESGDGQVVILSGDAGVGKTRLVREFLHTLDPDSSTILQYYGVHYSQHSALRAVINQLERAACINHDDSPDEKLDKLESTVRLANEDLSESVPLLAALLSIPTRGRYEPLNLSPELQHEHTFSVLESLLFALAKRRPVVLIADDMQWIDAVTLELLRRLAAKAHSLPVLLILTHRPEFVPEIPIRSYVTRVLLSRLSRDQCVEFSQLVTKGRALPDEVLQHVLEKSDGVPLFLEELIKSVLDSGALTEHQGGYALARHLPVMKLPNSLQDSLMARLDRQGAARGVAQKCAVIGRLR